MAEDAEDVTLMAGDTGEVRMLKEQNKLLEQNIEKAAGIGKMLLEENDNLNAKMDEFTKRLEVQCMV